MRGFFDLWIMGLDPENSGACKIPAFWLEQDKKKEAVPPPTYFFIEW
jgi:hypothetical protein